NSRPAARHHGSVEVEAGPPKELAERSRRQQRAVRRVHLLVGQVEASRDVAAAEPRPGLGLGAGEAAPRTRVQHLLAPARKILPDLRQAADEGGDGARREAPRGRCGRARLDRASRLSWGRCQLPSTTRRSGSARCAASHAVETVVSTPSPCLRIQLPKDSTLNLY